MQATNPAELRDVLPTVYADPALNDLLSRLNQTEQSLAALKVDYSTNYPDVMRQENLAEELNTEINARVKGIMDGLSNPGEQVEGCARRANHHGRGRHRKRPARSRTRPALHRQILRLAASHHSIDGDFFDCQWREIRRTQPDQFRGLARGAGQHPQHPPLGRRHHRQSVRPAAFECRLELVLIVTEFDPARGKPGFLEADQQILNRARAGCSARRSRAGTRAAQAPMP